MPLEIRQIGAFKRDLKRIVHQGKNLDELSLVVETLAHQQELPAKY